MKKKSLAKRLYADMKKAIKFDGYVKTRAKELVFGSHGNSFTEPANVEKTTLSSVYPDSWDPKSVKEYNKWCELNKVSSAYYLK